MKQTCFHVRLSCNVVGILLNCGLCSYPAHTQADPLNDLRHSPSPYECAVLSAHVYQEGLKEGEQVIVYESEDKLPHNLQDWTVSEILQPRRRTRRRNRRGNALDGYKGVIYVNNKKKQVVLAHRGTVPNYGALKTDIFAVAKNIIKGQERHLPKILERALAIAEQNGYVLTVTGHSLGGWLAQLTAFIARDNKQYRAKFHVKAVTFDTPGARPMLEQMNPKHDPVDIDQLDITNYLSSPNLVNACNPHVGTLYRVVFGSFPSSPLQHTLASHTISNFLSAFDPATGAEQKCVFVRSWPLVSKEILRKSQRGLRRILDGQLIGAVGSLLEILRMVNDGEILGQFSGFFRFAHKANQYHPDGLNLVENSTEDFECKFKYHYYAEPFDSTRLARRHLSDPVDRLLYHFDRGTPGLDSVDRDGELHGLDWDAREGILRTFLQEDVRPRVDRLLTIALHFPALCMKEVLERKAIPSRRTQVSLDPMAPPVVSFFVNRAAPLRQLREAYRQKNERTLRLLTGASGMGKTQLAAEFYQTIQGEYAYTFWLPAESKEKLNGAYIKMAEKLGIFITPNTPIKDIIREVQSYLADQPCFYVFDGAPNGKIIEDFLPQQQGHVLITSRNMGAAIYVWGHNIKDIQVPSFSREEITALAVKFQSALPCDDTSVLDFLSENMSGCPMALVQFFSSCQTQGVCPSAVVNALKARPLPEQDQELLQILRSRSLIGNAENLIQIIRTSLEQIQQEEYGTIAVELLSRLAYLDAKQIPVNWLLTFFPEDYRILNRGTRRALVLLERYALIQWDREYEQVYVHKITQRIVRNLRPQSSLKDLIRALITYVNAKGITEYSTLAIAMLPHGRMLFKRLDCEEYPQEAYELAKYLTTAAYRTGSLFQEALVWSEEELRIARKRYPHGDHLDIATALDDVGDDLMALGKLKEGLDHFREYLAMQQRIHGNGNHPGVATALFKVGRILTHLGDLEEGIAYLTESLTMWKCIHTFQDDYNDAMLLRIFRELGYASVRLGRLEEGIQYLQKGLVIQERIDPQKEHTYTADLLDKLGYASIEMGKLEAGLSYYRQALNVWELVFQDRDNICVATTLTNIGYALVQTGEFKEGMASLEKGLAMWNDVFKNQDHPRTADALHHMGYSLVHVGRLQEGITYLEKALCMKNRIYSNPGHPWTTNTLTHLGHAWVQAGNLGRGMEYLEKALATQRTVFNNNSHPWTATTLTYMGYTSIQIGKLEEGIQQLEESLRIKQANYKNQDHLWTANALTFLGFALVQAGRSEEGIDCLNQALAMHQRIHNAQSHPRMANTLCYLGYALVQKGNLELGVKYLRQSRNMQQRVYNNQAHPWVVVTLNYLGYVLTRLGQLREGIEHLKAALIISKRIYNYQDHYSTANTLSYLGYALVQAGKLKEGVACLKQALALRSTFHENQDHPWMAITLNYLGYALVKSGNPQKGIRYLKDALSMQRRVYANQEHPWIVATLANLGYALVQYKKSKRGLDYLQQGLAMQQRIFRNRDHPWTAYLLSDLGDALIQLQEIDPGTNYHQQALDIQKRLLGSLVHPDTAKMLCNMAITLYKARRYPKAQAYGEQALAMQRKIFKDSPHPMMVITLHNLGKTMQALGKHTAALLYYYQAVHTSLKYLRQEAYRCYSIP